MKVLSPALDMQSKQVDNVLDPTTAQDAATKAYVDARVPTSFNPNTWFGNDTALAAAPGAQPLAALTEVDDTNVTITLGGTPATALAKAVSITIGWTGTLALARGGLGVNAASVAAHTFFGNSTAGAAAPSFQQPDFTDFSGFVTAAQGGLPTGGTVGQVLSKLSSTNYNAGWKTPGNVQTANVTTAGTVSTVGIMAGLAASFTPAATGRALVIVSGYMTAAVAAQFAAVLGVRFSTGTAPTHGATAVGTTTAGGQAWGTSASAGALVPFAISTIVTGLTIGTAYWFDVVYGSSSASSTAKLNTTAVSVIEF